MELKQYQVSALERVREYLQKLAHWRGQAQKHPDLVDPDFPRRPWRDLMPAASPDFRSTQSRTGD